jgi:hypothetical protein
MDRLWAIAMSLLFMINAQDTQNPVCNGLQSGIRGFCIDEADNGQADLCNQHDFTIEGDSSGDCAFGKTVKMISRKYNLR